MLSYTRIFCFIVLLLISSHGYTQVVNKDRDSVFLNLNLKEVVITAKKVKQVKDTISFHVSTYRGSEDIVLEDVLKKMPGIKITSDGQIIYNGQWIKNFYIEGVDMLGGNYGTATKNIGAQDISSVQVIENHQDVKLLQGKKMGNSPVINIKLKSTNKGAWASSLLAALGSHSRLARDVSASLMTFKQEMQHLTILKTNNIGTDLRKEINAPASLGSILGTELILPEKLSIADTYSYRNNSYCTSINQLHKLCDDKSIVFNINYLYDNETRDATNITTYLTDSSSRRTINESNHASVRQHYIGGNLVYKLNSDKAYIKNNFTVNATIPKSSGLINSSIAQQLSGHSILADNTLTANFKKKNGAVSEFNWHLSYKDKSGTFHFRDQFLSQTIRQQAFHTDGSASLLAMAVPHVMFNLNTGFDAGWQKSIVTLNTTKECDSGIQQIFQIGIHASPKLYLHYNKFQLTASVPVGVIYYNSTNDDWHYKKPLLSAKLYSNLNYKLSSRLSFDLSTVCGESLPQALSLIIQKHYINYRTTMSNIHRVETAMNRSVRTSLSMTYTDVLNMLFSNLALIYAYSHNNNSTSYSFRGNVINYFTLQESTGQHTWQLSHTASKGFFLWNSKLSESFNIGTTKNSYYIGNVMREVRSDYLFATISYSASFTRWISLKTESSYTISKPYTDGKVSDFTYHTFANTSSLGIWPVSQLHIAPSIQYYFNNYHTNRRHNVFLDCTLEYDYKHAFIYIRCSNLLDNDTFQRVTDNGITRYYSEQRLRGRTLMLGLRIKII